MKIKRVARLNLTLVVSVDFYNNPYKYDNYITGFRHL